MQIECDFHFLAVNLILILISLMLLGVEPDTLAKKTQKKSLGTAQSADTPDFLRGQFTQTVSLISPKPILGKKVFPSHKYGHSYESPTYFQSQHSLICKETYDNPFIKAQGVMDKQVKSTLLRNLENFNISQQKFQNSQKLLPQLHKVHNLITNQDSFVQSPSMQEDTNTFHSMYLQIDQFKKHRCITTAINQQECFTDFIEKNDVLNVYGPLNMRDRPTQFRVTKDYSLDPEKQRIIKEAHACRSTMSKMKHTTNLTSLQNTQQLGLSDINSTLMTSVSKTFKTEGRLKKKLPSIGTRIIKKLPIDEDRFFSKDQAYLNDFTNQIIRQQMKKSIDLADKKVLSMAYNSDRRLNEYEENELNVIDQFERQLEFDRQYLSG